MVLPQSLEKQSQASRELIQKVSGERSLLRRQMYAIDARSSCVVALVVGCGIVVPVEELVLVAEAVLMVALVMPPLLRHLLWSPTTALLLLTVLTALLLSMFTLCDSSRPFLSCLRFSIPLPSSRCLPRLFLFPRTFVCDPLLKLFHPVPQHTKKKIVSMFRARFAAFPCVLAPDDEQNRHTSIPVLNRHLNKACRVLLPCGPMTQKKTPPTSFSRSLPIQVTNVVTNPVNDHLPLDAASRLCNSDLLSRTEQLICFAFHDSKTIIETTKEARSLNMIVTELYLD